MFGDQLLIIEFKEVPSISRSVYFTVPYVIPASHVNPRPPCRDAINRVSTFCVYCMLIIKCVFHLCIAINCVVWITMVVDDHSQSFVDGDTYVRIA